MMTIMNGSSTHRVVMASQRAYQRRRSRFASTTASTTSFSAPQENNASRAFEIALASSLAFCTTGALVWAFPSTRTAAPATASQYVVHGGGGGGGGGPVDSALGSIIFLDTNGGVGKQQQPSTNHSTLIHPNSSKAPWELLQNSTSAAAATTTSARQYDVSVRALKGGRLTMEDEYSIADGGRFCAVFDGHGGGGVSQYLKTRCYPKIQQKLEQLSVELSDASSVSSSAAALRAAFAELEEEIVANDAWDYQGSTAVAVWLHEPPQGGPRTLLSANIGDSRAILSRGGTAVDLTRDHKPNDEKEKTRILAMGETLEWDNVSKVHRVRNLSLSRALGDSYAKPVVSAQVDIQHTPIPDDQAEFALLASDGLWDVMTSQDVVTYVHRRMERELARVTNPEERANAARVLRRNMSKWVAREALRRGTADNVCVVMVWLDDVPGSSNGTPSTVNPKR